MLCYLCVRYPLGGNIMTVSTVIRRQMPLTFPGRKYNDRLNINKTKWSLHFPVGNIMTVSTVIKRQMVLTFLGRKYNDRLNINNKTKWSLHLLGGNIMTV